MGGVFTACAQTHQDCSIVAGVDKFGREGLPYPIYQEVGSIDTHADVLVDFSHPSQLSNLLSFGEKTGVSLVLCTTGYDEKQVEMVRNAAKKIPVFYSGNMSLGINLLIELSKKAMQVLGADFDIEIIEKHHNQKLDAPSGTALMIADSLNAQSAEEMHYVYDRHSQRRKRTSDEIGIHSVRGGTIVGEHEVIFAGPHEVITLSHSAESREIFALGALKAALFLAGKPQGLYSMADLLK